MAVEVIGHERVRDNPDRVKRRQPLEHSNKHLFLGVAEWPVSPCSQSPVIAVVPRILIIGLQSRLSHIVLLALMFRLAPDEPSIPLKDREGTISTPFRKIFAIICLSPVCG
jgi:hypothetical protein